MNNDNFQNALQSSFEKECATLNMLDIPMYEVSEKFEKKMSKLISRQRKPYFHLICTAGRRAACIVVAIIVLSASSLTVKAVREAVYDFFMKVFSDHTEVSTVVESDTSVVDKIYEFYEITNLPDGFELVDSSITDTNCYYKYRYGDKQIIFTQTINSQFTTYLDNENGDIEKFTGDDGTEYVIREAANDFIVIWSNEKYTFKISSNLDKELIFNLCKSTKAK